MVFFGREAVGAGGRLETRGVIESRDTRVAGRGPEGEGKERKEGEKRGERRT